MKAILFCVALLAIAVTAGETSTAFHEFSSYKDFSTCTAQIVI